MWKEKHWILGTKLNKLRDHWFCMFICLTVYIICIKPNSGILSIIIIQFLRATKNVSVTSSQCFFYHSHAAIVTPHYREDCPGDGYSVGTQVFPWWSWKLSCCWKMPSVKLFNQNSKSIFWARAHGRRTWLNWRANGEKESHNWHGRMNQLLDSQGGQDSVFYCFCGLCKPMPSELGACGVMTGTCWCGVDLSQDDILVTMLWCHLLIWHLWFSYFGFRWRGRFFFTTALRKVGVLVFSPYSSAKAGW